MSFVLVLATFSIEKQSLSASKPILVILYLQAVATATKHPVPQCYINVYMQQMQASLD